MTARIDVCKLTSETLSPELLTTVVREIARRLRKETRIYLVADRWLIRTRNGPGMWDVVKDVLGYEPRRSGADGQIDANDLEWEYLPDGVVSAIIRLHGKGGSNDD